MNKLFELLSAVILAVFSDPSTATNAPDQDTYIKNPVVVKTDTRFSQKEISESEVLSFETIYQEDSDVDFGQTKVVQEGRDGEKISTYLLTYYDQEILDKTLINAEVEEPVDKIVSKGTKIVWKEETSERCGTYDYWHKYENVYMTTYTPQCLGCNAWTSLGLTAGYGVIAVDPKKIPYWTKVCIPRYGIAIAGDTGGALRSYPGLLIDLGFKSLLPQDKWLTTGRYDMYILNNEEKAEKFYVVE